MARSLPPEPVLELGKRLVHELRLNDSTDTLSRWLAHALAEKIQAVEAAKDTGRTLLEREVIDLILKLWSHRGDFPTGRRPFEDLEDLARVLRQLEPENAKSRYFNLEALTAIDEAPSPAKIWLNRALVIENAARAAISHCLLAADEATPGDRHQWADLGEAAGFGSDVEITIVRFVGRLMNDLRDEALSDVATRALHTSKEKAALLRNAASEVEADVAKKLRSMRRRKPRK